MGTRQILIGNIYIKNSSLSKPLCGLDAVQLLDYLVDAEACVNK